MSPLPFNLALVQFLAGHRTVLLTSFFHAATFFGDSSGYLLVATLIYVAWNKQLAIRLSVLVLLTSSLNGILKLIVKNPRPFIREGTYLSKWAVSPQKAAALATEYSTPSGHAMSSSAFYSYLYACAGNRCVRVIAVLAIVLIGVSRPYLGVHYAEDVLIGWAIGLSAALLWIRHDQAVCAAWSRLSYARQIGAAVAASLALWLLTVAVNGWRAAGQPREVLISAGFLTGIVIARPLELRMVNFDPRSSNAAAKTLRYIFSIAMVTGTLLFLDKALAMIPGNFAMLGYMLQYVRYAAAGIVSIFLAPLLFTRIGLAETMPPGAN
ncbi:MAG TPA: phosphatase PAP2 family protein [Terracidiphilus sp.]|nr:phosphatase PAP2 family protein [Terracidiphilus sp.]